MMTKLEHMNSILLMRGIGPLEFLPNIVSFKRGSPEITEAYRKMRCALVLMCVDWSGSPKFVGNTCKVKNYA